MQTELEQLTNSITALNRSYPKDFEILRNSYVSGDGSTTEILEIWASCPRNGDQILQPTGREPKTYYYAVPEHHQIVLGEKMAEDLKIERRPPSGNLVITTPEEVERLHDHLTREERLNGAQIHFLMTPCIPLGRAVRPAGEAA